MTNRDGEPRPANLRSIFASFFLLWILSWLVAYGLSHLIHAITGWTL